MNPFFLFVSASASAKGAFVSDSSSHRDAIKGLLTATGNMFSGAGDMRDYIVAGLRLQELQRVRMLLLSALLVIPLQLLT